MTQDPSQGRNKRKKKFLPAMGNKKTLLKRLKIFLTNGGRKRRAKSAGEKGVRKIITSEEVKKREKGL
jgi:hypothetical protein